MRRIKIVRQAVWIGEKSGGEGLPLIHVGEAGEPGWISALSVQVCPIDRRQGKITEHVVERPVLQHHNDDGFYWGQVWHNVMSNIAQLFKKSHFIIIS
jgi:hypothetical protein